MQHQQAQLPLAQPVMQWQFICSHCRIAFADEILYHIHMGYHSFDDPFKCNRCNHASSDAVTHSLHLMQAKHEPNQIRPQTDY